jgi:acid phosphatase
MYSSEESSYQEDLRNAFQGLLLEYSVDLYLSGHIHWYERLYPLTKDGKVDHSAVIDDNTYKTNPGKSLTHIINGMAGNIESHSTLSSDESKLKITNVLDQKNYGFSKLTIHSAKKLTWQMVQGKDGEVGDELTLLKS